MDEDDKIMIEQLVDRYEIEGVVQLLQDVCLERHNRTAEGSEEREYYQGWFEFLKGDGEEPTIDIPPTQEAL